MIGNLANVIASPETRSGFIAHIKPLYVFSSCTETRRKHNTSREVIGEYMFIVSSRFTRSGRFPM